MRARALSLGFLAVMSFGLPACSDDPFGPRLSETFTGTIQVMNGTTVAANARVLVVWGVSFGPDYSYVWGSGTRAADGSFTITFDGPPPEAALNNNQVGVGLVILTTDQNVQEGVLSQSFDASSIIGLSEDYSIIFTQNLSAELQEDFPGRFNGY